MNKIGREIRRNIFDWLRVNKISWYGVLNDIDFLSRIYNLDELPSTDHRLKTMKEDIHQHRLSFTDWDDDWVYWDDRLKLMECNDKDFICFLCEMLHPIIRPGVDEQNRVLHFFNDELGNVGFEITKHERLSGYYIYQGVLKLGPYKNLELIKENANVLDAGYLHRQIKQIENSIESEPENAIGLAKELIETVSKTILDELSVHFEKDWSIVKLVKKVLELLDIASAGLPTTEQSAEPLKNLIRSLAATLHNISEIRNLYGSGHGKEGKRKKISPIYARLMSGVSSTISVFLFDLYEGYVKSNKNVLKA